MENNPNLNEPLEGGGSQDIPEDSFISETLGGLSEIRVPSEFLPNVMFQVYERHHRDKVSWPRVFVVSLVLLACSLGFFAWDVSDYQEAQSLGSFQKALDQKMDLVLGSLDNLFSAVSGVVGASWQLVGGATKHFFLETPGWIQFLILLLAIALAWLLKKTLSRMVH